MPNHRQEINVRGFSSNAILLGYDEATQAAKLNPAVKSSIQCSQKRTPGFAWNCPRGPA
jgi:hypothetical protein